MEIPPTPLYNIKINNKADMSSANERQVLYEPEKYFPVIKTKGTFNIIFFASELCIPPKIIFW